MLLLSVIWFSSCRSIQYVPMETVKEKIAYRDRLQRDSIHILDSIFMWSKGDTVFKDRWRIEYRDRLMRDTTYIEKTDSIQVLILSSANFHGESLSRSKLEDSR